MQLKSKLLSRRPAGYGLIIVMVFVGISLIIFASMLLWTSTNSRITNRNNIYNQSEAAAESATETALTSMIRDYAAQSLNPPSVYQTNIPSTTSWPVQYEFSDLNGHASQISIVLSPIATWQVLDAPYNGQYGLVIDCTNTATATPLNLSQTVPATVQQSIKFADIPLFQYAVFYNMDLEMNPGSAMTINGHVHSNNSIYATGDSSGAPLIINGNMEGSTGINYTRNSAVDPSAARTGNVIVTNGVANPSGATLAMPIGTNNSPSAVEALLNLPPSSISVPSANGYSTNGATYLYNSADLIVTNDVTGTNIAVYYDNQNNATKLTLIPPDVVVVTTNNGVASTNAYYSFVTNATFYDYRESDTVQATQLSVTNLNNWLTNVSARGGAQYNTMNNSGSTSKGHGINSVYVYSSVPPSTTTLPAVRVVGGQQLPSAGLTVATPLPLYVQGNYNTTTNGINFASTLGSTTNGNTVPAALMGDSITVLSSAWQDSYNANTSLGSRNPTSTTINAATLEGIVQSVKTSGNKYYSGGLENFLRLEENWGGKTLTYNGSIVVLFPSQYATNAWNLNYYSVPNRQWGFDLNYTKGTQYLPPLTPQVREIIRRTWSAISTPNVTVVSHANQENAQ
jgi:hypothetical protein